ncbi:MAG: precorrin-2 C(20)-methyltransferase [Spirochaetaceae bacterium]|jgi:precorrin-2/cobalt-factor-2 C20-methyltransferase|nr:precorrin-2 C(20)-methyltransferase [Spirochaetaceae bacterium]
MKNGVFYGIGVGPGDPELITVKALKTIAACSCVSFIDPGKGRKAAAFEIARAAMPEIELKEKIRLVIPMTQDKELMRTHHIAAFNAVSERLNAGIDVCFLTIGDVSIYSTFGYLQKIARDKGFETRMVSGVPSFCAAAAVLNTDLVLGEQNLHVFYTGETELDKFLALKGTQVFMKGPSAVPNLIKLIKEKGLDAGLVSNCGMDNQIVVKPVKEIPIGQEFGYYSLVIVKEGEG